MSDLFTRGANWVADQFRGSSGGVGGGASGGLPDVMGILNQIKSDVEGLPSKLEQGIGRVLSDIKALLEKSAGPPPPPMDPMVAVKRIAEAMREAERTLNEQNLVVARGSVDIDLQVKVGPDSGAHARISFEITPKPYH